MHALGKLVVLPKVLFLFCSISALGDTIQLRTDTTWRTIAGAVPVAPDWNSSLSFDDSNAAGWTNSFKSPIGDRIWNTSNLSSLSPANPRFRDVFDLYGPVSSCVGHFYFDDDATVWVNGVEVLNDTDGVASTFDNVALSPSLFRTGNNLIAVWGHNTVPPDNNIEVDLTLTIVPEPSVLSLLVGGALLSRVRAFPRRRASVRSEWRLDKSAIFGGLTFAITAAMGNFFEPMARLV